MRKLLLLILLFSVGHNLLAQDTSFSNLFYLIPGTWDDHAIDRLDIKYNAGMTHTALRPLQSGILRQMDTLPLTPHDRFHFSRVATDYRWDTSSQEPILKHFYTHPSFLYSVNTDNFKLGINPVFHLELGTEFDTSRTPYINSRGIEVRGIIADKIGFYTFLTENQADFRTYINQQAGNNFNIIPHENNAKIFKSGRIFKNAYDYFSARGYVTFRPVKPILVQFGQDRNFIGNGYRSLILSDWSKDYMALKIQTEIWRIKYTNLYAQLIDYRNRSLDRNEPRKFLSAHHLNIAITDNLEIGLFEAVAFGNTDTVQRPFDFYYMNPIIFYRSVEFALGSPDNMFVGANWKYNFLGNFQLYGQFVLDEFKFWELVEGTGWWANKFGLQNGLKYVDVAGVEGLDIQVEHNFVRPYTYTHRDLTANYAHYRQPLAHPLGANFKETVGIVRYQPLENFWFYGRIIKATKGEDSTKTNNMGGDIFKSYQTHPKNYGNTIGQGVHTDLLNIELVATWRIKQNMYLDLLYNFRNLNSDFDERDLMDSYLAISFRMNSPLRDWGF